MRPNWFVAIPIPARDWLPGVLADLPDQCRGFVAEDVHMTVAFLGAMSPERQEQVILAMKALVTQPCQIQLGPLLCLPTPKRVSALSFSVAEGQREAHELIGLCRGSLYFAAGSKIDDRPPLAHITIARPIRKWGPEGQQQAIIWARSRLPPSLEISLSELALYTWSQDRTTRQFQIVYRQPL